MGIATLVVVALTATGTAPVAAQDAGAAAGDPLVAGRGARGGGRFVLLSYNPGMSTLRPRQVLPAVVLSAVLTGSACESIDVRAALRVTEVRTGWLDVGFDDLGRNKLVPTISFRMENVSDQRLRTLQLNGVFRRCRVPDAGQPAPEDPVSPADEEAGTCLGEDREWGSHLVRAAGREGVVPGGGLGPFTLESSLGYTGEQALAEMLRHRDFVDVKIELFVRHRAEQWAKLGEYRIDRRLLTR